jgi:hypothetical protein
MRVRVEMLERAAEAKSVFLPYRVTMFFPHSTLVKSVYYVCGKCTMKEPDYSASGSPEQRDHEVPANAYCHYCDHRAVPWAG